MTGHPHTGTPNSGRMIPYGPAQQESGVSSCAEVASSCNSDHWNDYISLLSSSVPHSAHVYQRGSHLLSPASRARNGGTGHTSAHRRERAAKSRPGVGASSRQPRCSRKSVRIIVPTCRWRGAGELPGRQERPNLCRSSRATARNRSSDQALVLVRFANAYKVDFESATADFVNLDR